MKPKRCERLWPFTGQIPDGQRRRCTLERGHTGPHTIIPPSGMDYAPDDESDIEPPVVLYDWTDALGERFRLTDGPRPAGMGFERLLDDGTWGRSSPLPVPDLAKAMLGLVCEVRRLNALYEGEKQLRRREVEGLNTVIASQVRLIEEREPFIAQRDKERDDQTNHAIRVNREEAGQAGYDRALQDIGYTVSVGMIAAERRRQVEGESWTSSHDDGHDSGQLALAAACYAIESAGRGSVEYRLGHDNGIEINIDALGLYWPFNRDWWKPGSEIRNLVKAGALIAAEIDRRLRAGEEP